MQIIILWKIYHHHETLVFVTQIHTAISQSPCNRNRAKSLFKFNMRYPGGVTCFSIHGNLVSWSWRILVKVPPYSLIHSYHPESKQTFLGKFCASVLFHNCFAFSIKMPGKYSSADCKRKGKNSLISQVKKALKNNC